MADDAWTASDWSMGSLGPDGSPEVWTAAPCWVNLDKAFTHDPETPNTVNVLGLDLDGEVPGLVVWWIPTKSGDWMGVVNLDIPYVDRQRIKELRGQLVSRIALRPRADNAPLLGRRVQGM